MNCRNCGAKIYESGLSSVWVHFRGREDGWQFCENHKQNTNVVASGPIAEPLGDNELVDKLLTEYYESR